MHSVETYFNLIQIGSPTKLTDEQAVSFASTFLSGIAANWWYSLVCSNANPKTWNAFKAAVENEFVPKNSSIRARDKLAKITQKYSVGNYLNVFRNLVIDISDISDSEKLARFCEGLKPHILLEVRKSNPSTFDEAAKIALDVDGAYFGAGVYGNASSGNDGPVPMQIGNLENLQEELKLQIANLQKLGARGRFRNPLTKQQKIDMKKMLFLSATDRDVAPGKRHVRNTMTRALLREIRRSAHTTS